MPAQRGANEGFRVLDEFVCKANPGTDVPVAGSPMTEERRDFRFTDPELQSRLIEAIEAAGLTHKVAEDGTILYPSDQSIEDFINQVVDSVFPGAYQRIDITDSVKAERYRRFTKRHGTVIIEETRDGETSFVHATREKIYRTMGMPTHVSFAILRDDLDPDKVTARLGISPTFACRKGEPFGRLFFYGRRKHAPLYPSRTGWWELRSTPELESNDIVLHLTWLLEILEPVSAIIESIAGPPTEEGPRVVRIDIVDAQGPGGASLTGAMLRRLGSLCDHIDVRFWADDYL